MGQAIKQQYHTTVIAINDTADRRFDAGLAQPFRVANGQVLRPAIAVMNQALGLRRFAVMDGLLEGI
ncbi:hypothetical protein J4E08_23710 [Sagittula sp. NFXS13]